MLVALSLAPSVVPAILGLGGPHSTPAPAPAPTPPCDCIGKCPTRTGPDLHATTQLHPLAASHRPVTAVPAPRSRPRLNRVPYTLPFANAPPLS